MRPAYQAGGDPKSDKPSPSDQVPVTSPTPLPVAAMDVADPEIKAAYKLWTIAFINREKEKLLEHKQAFADSGIMSITICWVAHILLVWALLAATIEYICALVTRKRASAQMQELSVSLEGIALKTSLHGTLLLGIAMIFYFLFLKYVYPITVIAT